MQTPTSIKAYINEVAPTLGARRIAVLEVFERVDTDFTNSELAQSLGWSINRVTGRVKELRDLGILELSETRPCKVTNRTVHAWKVKNKEVRLPVYSRPTDHYQYMSSSEPARTHTVRQIGDRVTCSCKGFHYRRTCRHVRAIDTLTPRPADVMRPLF